MAPIRNRYPNSRLTRPASLGPPPPSSPSPMSNRGSRTQPESSSMTEENVKMIRRLKRMLGNDALKSSAIEVQESNPINYDNSLVGSRVKVWWPKDEKFYKGVIESFDYDKKKHRVHYNDGEEEILNLRKERWEFIGDESVSDGDSDVEDSSDDTSSSSDLDWSDYNFTSQRKKKKKESTISESSKRSKIHKKNRAFRSSGKSCILALEYQGDFGEASAGTSLPKTTPSSSKGGEGNNSLWPSGGTPLPQATHSTLRCLSQMLNEGVQTDVTIIASDGSVKAHKSILSIRSPVFRSMFQDDLREKVSTVEMKDMTSESCTAFLSFLYGSLNKEGFLRHRMDLLGAASKYDILDLKDACEQSLFEDINHGNVIERLTQAWVYKLDKLKKGCFTYLLDLEKIYDLREEMNVFVEQADRGLLVEMFQELLAVLKRN